MKVFSQDPTTGPYPSEMNKKFVDTPKGVFPSGFSNKLTSVFIVFPMRVTFPAHLILLHRFILEIFYGKYKLRSSLSPPDFLLSFFFDPEDGGDVFLRNVS
jgi:hypothetical protein